MAKIATLRTRIRARVCAHLTLRNVIPVPVGYRLRAGRKPKADDRATTKRKAAARNVTLRNRTP